MKYPKTRLLAAAMLAGIASCLAAPVALAAGASSSTHLLAAADPAGPPFAYLENGKEVGFDIDMLNAIVKAEGMTVDIKPMPWTGVIPSLQSGAIDVSADMITIKKSRMQSVNFSNAYYRGGLSVMTLDKSDIKTIDDLKDGKVIGAKKAAASVDYLLQNGIDANHIKQFQSIASAYSALMTGGVDAVIHDNPVNIAFANKHDDVRFVGGILKGQYYGIAISKKRPELVAKINAGLEKIRANGQYKKILQKWFGSNTSGAVWKNLKPEDVAIPE